MCQLTEKIASEKGISIEDADYVFVEITKYLLSKIPALSQVINDVFENANEGILQEDVNKAIQSIQQEQWKDKFKDFHVTPQTYTNHQSCSGGELF